MITCDDFIKSVEKADKDGKGLDWINREIRCPVRFKDATPDKLDKKIKKLAGATFNTKTFLLYGNVGTGKTFSVYAIAKWYYVNGLDVKVNNFVDVLDKIKRSFNFTDSDEFIEGLLFGDDVFILDDLGAEKITEWSVEILHRLINKRYENMMPLIITTNLSMKEIAIKYGDRIASRITEMMGDNIIKFTGKDRRMG
jgi:DNA replication protein DnaC